MVEQDPHRAVSDMKARINKVRAEHEPDDGQKYSSAGVAFRIGIDLISGVAFGVLAGLFLDNWLGTKPWLLIVFIILGTAAGIRNVIRTAATLEEENK